MTRRHRPVLQAALAAAICLAGCGGAGGSSAPSGNAPAASSAAASSPASAPGAAAARWQPLIGDTWQWQLSGPLNRSYDVAIYNLDLFDTPAATIAALRAEGRRVVCYFSAGSGEEWRPDYSRFTPSDLGRPLDGWAGERWLDTRSASVRDTMKARLDLAASKGCDGVEPDNVDAYSNDSGLPLTAATQLDYNRFLAGEAHLRRLAIGLKNDTDQIDALEAHFDFAVNEQCFEYNECAAYQAFTAKSKPVLNAEYAARYRNNTEGARDALCAAAKAAKIRTLVLALELDDRYRHSCD